MSALRGKADVPNPSFNDPQRTSELHKIRRYITAQFFFFAFFFALPAISFLMRFTEAPETNMSTELSPPWSLRARFHEWTDDSSDKPSRLSSPSSVMWIILTMVTSHTGGPARLA